MTSVVITLYNNENLEQSIRFAPGSINYMKIFTFLDDVSVAGFFGFNFSGVFVDHYNR